MAYKPVGVLTEGGGAGHILLCWPEGAGTGACCLGLVLAGLGASGLMEAGGDFCNTIVKFDYESHQSAGMQIRSDPGWCVDPSCIATIDHAIAQDGIILETERQHMGQGTQRQARPVILHCAHAAAQSSRACRQGMSVSYT